MIRIDYLNEQEKQILNQYKAQSLVKSIAARRVHTHPDGGVAMLFDSHALFRGGEEVEVSEKEYAFLCREGFIDPIS